MKRARRWRPMVERAAPWLCIAALVLGTLAMVSRWEDEGAGKTVSSTVRVPRKPVARPPGNAAIPAPTAPVDPVAFVDLFPRQDWAPPPPPPAQQANVPAPPSQPPPLPFAIGSLWLDDSGAFYAVLTAQGREFPLCVACRQSGFYREGDVLMGIYRIERVTSHEVRFVYLPMKRRQQMSLEG